MLAFVRAASADRPGMVVRVGRGLLVAAVALLTLVGGALAAGAADRSLDQVLAEAHGDRVEYASGLAPVDVVRFDPIRTDQRISARALENLRHLDVEEPRSSSDRFGLPWLAPGVAAGLLAIGVGVRRWTSKRAVGGLGSVVVYAGSGPVDGPTFDRLLGAGRRMTGALQAEQVIRLVVDEASESTDARAGDFVRVRLAGGEPDFEVVRATEGRRNPTQCADGMLRRAGVTGQGSNRRSR